MHERLIQRAQASPDQLILAPRLPIADTVGSAKFHVTTADSSSSLLSPSCSHEGMADIFSVETIIEVPTRMLASLFSELVISYDRIFLKPDIQGGEEKALKGAEKILDQVGCIVAEIPLRE